MRYPEIARKAGVQGRVTVVFVVDEQGRVSEATKEEGIGAGADEQVMWAVRDATFEPARDDGNVVSATMQVQVYFSLKCS